jgi:hypothetical protein
MHAAILALLLSYAPWHEDAKREAPGDRAARMAVLADGIHEATVRATCQGLEPCTPIWPGPATELAAALARIGWFESRYASHVHAGRCRRYECDATKLKNGRIIFRATSTWQLQSSRLVPMAEWRTLAGTAQEPTSRAAWAAARVLAASYTRCAMPGQDGLVGAVSLYATGRTCRWPRAAQRVSLIRRDAKRLAAATD